MLAYDASKTEKDAFTVHLASELRDTPIKVNSAHPGWVKTEMGGEGAQLEVNQGSKTTCLPSVLRCEIRDRVPLFSARTRDWRSTQMNANLIR